MNHQTLNFDLLLNSISESIAERVSQKINISQVKESVPPEERFLDTIEAMKFLKIKSPVTLKKYVASGLIPKPSKIGGRKLVYKKSDLLNFLSNAQG
jgi:predicted DNA-binding transcriptional regulator AlpA